MGRYQLLAVLSEIGKVRGQESKAKVFFRQAPKSYLGVWRTARFDDDKCPTDSWAEVGEFGDERSVELSVVLEHRRVSSAPGT